MDMKIMQPSFQYRLRFIKFLTYLLPCSSCSCSSCTVAAVLLSLLPLSWSSCSRCPLVMYWTTQTHATMHDLHTLSYKPFTGDFFVCFSFYVVLVTTVGFIAFTAGLASDSLDKENCSSQSSDFYICPA